MKTLVVVATEKEIEPLLIHFGLPKGDLIVHPNFDILITGVGISATSFALGKHLNSNYQLVLNLGIAGAFDKNIALGSLVRVSTDIFSELGAEDDTNFIPIDVLGLAENTFHDKYPHELDLPKVKAITVNTVHGNQESILKVAQQFNPTIESMEGASVFYACGKENLPCLQVRCISNYVEKRYKLNWKIDLAIENLNKWAIYFLKSLK